MWVLPPLRTHPHFTTALTLTSQTSPSVSIVVLMKLLLNENVIIAIDHNLSLSKSKALFYMRYSEMYHKHKLFLNRCTNQCLTFSATFQYPITLVEIFLNSDHYCIPFLKHLF